MTTGFFLIAHDEFSGKVRIHPDLLLCGLVGAQIADLVIGGRLTMSGDRVTVVDPDVAGLDEMATLVLDSVAHDRETHTVRAWNDVLNQLLLDLTTSRLVADRILRKESARSLLGRRREHYPALDLVRARHPELELRAMFTDPATFTLPGAFTAAMIDTLGLDTLLEPGIERSVVRSIAGQAAEHLPGSLSQLRSGLAASVSAISLTIRR
ncbi:MAG: GPP34 family phosphoprotein [Pseudonocardia sp.]|nr:GPP34 family phosphoprotein [Pseudonocardia sp.]